ncbi:MAG: hypothetical protein ACRDPR_21810, partial [Nocardioidaceae bacterium]
MSSDRDTTRIVRSWLDEGATVLPDRVLDAVLDQVPATPQRRSWWPARRFADMNTLAKLAIAAAAVVVVAVFIGLQVFGGSNVGGPGLTGAPSQTPESSPSPTPTLSPVPTPAAEIPPAGPLAIGSHAMTLGGVRLSIEIPTDGWISNGQFGIDKGNFELDTPDAAGFIFWTHSAADNVYADPCARTPLSPPAGPSAAELAAAVSTVPGIALVSGPSEVSVGGYPAQHVVVTVPEDIGCAPSDFHLWYDADTPGDARYATALNSTIYVWIIDVDGTLV